MTLQADSTFFRFGTTSAPTTRAVAREPEQGQTCAHCRLPVPAGLIEPGADVQFCCGGCRAVYAAVTSCGLDTYYRLRDAANASLSPAHPGQSKYEPFDTPAFEKLYVRTIESSNLRSADLFLEGVTCAACVWLVEKLPTLLPGVVEARLALRRATVRITWDASKVSLSQIARTLDGFGYPPHPAKGLSREAMYRKEYRSRLIKLGAAGALMGNLMLLGAALYAGWVGGMDSASAMMLRWLSLILGVISLASPGAEFFRSAWTAIRCRSINLDVPICIALGVGGVAGTINVVLNRGDFYFDSLAALVFLLLVGRFLQFRQQRSAESAVELLYSMTPQMCHVVGDSGSTTDLPIESLEPGMTVEIRPGELLPADGLVLSGTSSVDQALLTGESIPVAVTEGSEVFGGSQNGPSPLHIRVTRSGEHSRVGKLMQLLERGLGEKPAIVRFSDKVGVVFTVLVTALGAGVFGYWAYTGPLSLAIDHTVAFLIVTCPCVLGLATPMTLAVAIGQLAKRDILVRSGGALERLARGGSLILDKTGTLTRGKMRVIDYSGDLCLRGVVARIERHSNHPVARALVETFEGCEPPAHLRGAMKISEQLAGGITAEIDDLIVRVGSPAFMARCGIHQTTHPSVLGESTNTVVLVAVGNEVRGTITLGDELRHDSAAALKALRRLGFKPQICSGDATPVVRYIARELDVAPERAEGGVSPEGKLATVHRAEAMGPTVMVGDGVNDAAALAAAGVSIAVHGGSEACLAAADVYIARPGLAPVVDVVRTARRTLAVIHRNFAVSAAYNLFAGVLAATGYMNPLVAAILMPLSSATVLALAVAQMKYQPKN